MIPDTIFHNQSRVIRNRVDTGTKRYRLSDVLKRNPVSWPTLHRFFYRKLWR